MLAAEDAVNTYLIEKHEVCLEEVLTDAADGRRRQSIADEVQVTAVCLDRSRDEDGALVELYEGVLTLQGVRYGWRAAFYTDLDGQASDALLRTDRSKLVRCGVYRVALSIP